MEGSLQYLQPLAQSNDENQLTEYLNFTSESKLFCAHKSNKDDVTSLINSLLSTKDNSNEGLLILDIFIGQCPLEILNSNALSWTQKCVKYLVNPENGSLSPPAFKVLGSLLEISSNLPEVRKEIALTIIPKLLDHFIREYKGKREDIFILECLERVLKYYGKSCGFHKDALSKIIFSHLSTPGCNFIAAKCYLHLATCGGPGADGVNYITAWHNQQKFLLNSLHAQLDRLFENIGEVNDNHKKHKLEDSHPTIPNVVQHPLIKRKQYLAKQFEGLGEFFKILLLGSFPVRKRILPESILGLVWRGLSINYHTLSVGHLSIDTSSLLTVVSTINRACLEILDSLILSCSMNLISYSKLICRILTQTLKWTEVENWPFGLSKPHCFLRAKIYNCLGNWLSVSRSCSGIDKYLDDLVSAIITDINHDPPSISLKAPGGKGKKKIKEIKSVQAAQSSLEFIVNPEMNSESCEAALKFISSLLNSVATLMKSDHHKELQTAVVSKLISIQQCRFPVPYSNQKCRLAIYEALLSLCQNCHHSFQPPVSYATVIFGEGIKDISVEVSRFCLFSLRSIEKILRPICPTLDFPATDEAINRINISVALDETCLLNDSRNQKMTKRKRNSQQITSTPVNANQSRSKFNYTESETPVSVVNNIQNLSDFERGANYSMEDTEFNHNSTHSSADNDNGIFSENMYRNNLNGNIGGKRLRMEKEKVKAIPTGEEFSKISASLVLNPEPFSIENGTYNKSGPSEQNLNPKDETPRSPDEIIAPKPSVTNDTSKNQANIEIEKHETSRDDDVGDNEDSDDEMLNSFVDEVIETSQKSISD